MLGVWVRGLIRWLLPLALVQSFPLVTTGQDSALPPSVKAIQQPATAPTETIQEYNLRLRQLEQALADRVPRSGREDYAIGPEDLLEVSVFEASEFNCVVRVSASGEISVPMLGAVRVEGMTALAAESVLRELLRQSYLKDPHVHVFVKEMQSHPVSVFGAVRKPGVYQIRGAKSLLQILSMSEGLADDAGETVLVIHHGDDAGKTRGTAGRSSPETTAKTETALGPHSAAGESFAEEVTDLRKEEVSVKSLLESSDARSNVAVYPGDTVKVARAGVVYVVGEVRKPGGFQLQNNEKITMLQALALAEGLTRVSAKAQARIIRHDEKTGQRAEIPVDLRKLFAGKIPDPELHPKDIVFVPNSAGRTAIYRGLEAALSVGTGLAIYRR